MQLVEVKKSEVFCDSHLVARKFNQKHAYVIRKIKNVISDVAKLRVTSNNPSVDPECFTEEREYRGQKYTSYLMNRDFFSLLVMRFRGKDAVKWQLRFIAAFNSMEQQLLKEKTNAADPAWLKVRDIGKIARKEETDVIKEFVEYAEKQGSTKAGWYYSNVTNATYRALGLMVQRKPKLRDMMDIYEISELLLAERIARQSLRKYMDLGRHYKDIYESVKEDLENFGSGLKLE